MEEAIDLCDAVESVAQRSLQSSCESSSANSSAETSAKSSSSTETSVDDEMVLLSFDPGCKNPGLLIAQGTPSVRWKVLDWSATKLFSSDVEDWSIYDAADETPPIEEAVRATYPWLVRKLHGALGSETIKWPSKRVAIIEAQPVNLYSPGTASINIRTKCLSHAVQAFLLTMGFSVSFVHVAGKERQMKRFAEWFSHNSRLVPEVIAKRTKVDFPERTTYSRRKKNAVSSCWTLLHDPGCARLFSNIHRARQLFTSLHPKMDDGADALLNAWNFLETGALLSPKKPDAPRCEEEKAASSKEKSAEQDRPKKKQKTSSKKGSGQESVAPKQLPLFQ